MFGQWVSGQRIAQEHHGIHLALDDPGADLHVAPLGTASHALDRQITLLGDAPVWAVARWTCQAGPVATHEWSRSSPSPS